VTGRRLTLQQALTGLIVGAIAITAVSIVIAALKDSVDPVGLTGLYLFAILPVAVGWGFFVAGVVAVASFLTFGYFFAQPLHSFRVADSDTAVALVIAFVSAYVVSQLARRANERAGDAQLRAREAEQAQTELRMLAGEQAAQRRVATLVARGGASADLFEAVTREVGLQCDAELARMERFEPDHTVTAIAAWSRSGEARLAVGTRFALEGASIAAQVHETGRAARVDSFVGASGPIAREAQELGIRSSIGCPIVVGGRTWGVIAASATREAGFPPETESRIAEFTELAATAIANAEAREELRRVADEQAALRRVATLVARAAPPPVVFATVTEEVYRLLSADITALTRFDGDAVTVLARWPATSNPLPPGVQNSLAEGPLTRLLLDTGAPARVDPYPETSATAAQFGIRSAVGAPITVEGRMWGGISVVSTGDESPPPGTEERLGGFAELVGTAIANAASQVELRASRARVVATADETRRRIERDLHDGAQQRLISVALQVRGAQAHVPPGLDQLDATLEGIVIEIEDVLEELQEMARGIHPTVLSRGGLAPALKTLARRSSVPVELDVRMEGRLPEPLEVGAYYVVSEALTNAAKHARARSVTVEVETVDGVLRVWVRDDGVGGADLTRGSGLVGLKDRAEALGGQIAVESPPNAGTAIRVELPLSDEPGTSWLSS
jgi:signal transduction histidine kinase